MSNSQRNSTTSTHEWNTLHISEYAIFDYTTREHHRRILHTESIADALELVNFWNSIMIDFKYVLGDELYDVDKRVKLVSKELRAGREIRYFIREG